MASKDLRAGQAAATKVATAFYASIGALSNREQDAMFRYLGTLTNTNCWWLVYRLGPTMQEIVGDQAKLRAAPKGVER